jgi:hypothetical protein
MKLPGLASVLAKTVRILFCEKSPICSLSFASTSEIHKLGRNDRMETEAFIRSHGWLLSFVI